MNAELESRTVLVLGAGGRLGRHVATAFADAGWSVRSAARRFLERDVPGKHVMVDALDPSALAAAASGCDVLVHAVNPAYRHWSREVPQLASAVIEAARSSGATLMVPGNVYGYGEGMPPVLSAATPMAPTNGFGDLRVALEDACRDAAGEGVQTIVVRAGSFIEGRRTGNWFEDHIVKDIGKGKVMYPGPLDRTHTWAWLPDLARVFVALAEERDALDPFNDVGFPGWALTGRELIDVLEGLQGRALKIETLPWPLLRLASLIPGDMRGVVAMRYLWERPHRIDGTELARRLPDYRSTAPEEGLADALRSS